VCDSVGLQTICVVAVRELYNAGLLELEVDKSQVSLELLEKRSDLTPIVDGGSFELRSCLLLNIVPAHLHTYIHTYIYRRASNPLATRPIMNCYSLLKYCTSYIIKK